MASSSQFLAFDLGAESGRAVLGKLRAGVLDVTEIHRFGNEPVRQNGSLHWDVLRLWLEIKRGLERASSERVASVGVDAWGCDYALLGERGTLVQNPYHYRDARTDGVMEEVFTRVPRDDIYDVTGIQFLPFNTLYQLYAACRATPRLIDAANAFGTIPDLVNFWLTGSITAEFTNATTTQFVDARTRTWATGLLNELGMPTRLLPRLVEPGTVIGSIIGDAPASLVGTPVVAPACHDTGSAVAAVPRRRAPRLLSSGTWSLLGTELASPVITPRARELNFTNEGGVDGTTRLLKNIAGLWLLQACRRDWAAQGHDLAYDELLTLAREHQPPFRSLFDPDHGAFLHPSSMVPGDRAVLPRDRSAGAADAGRLRARDPREPRLQVPRRPRVARGADRHRHHRDPRRRRRLAQPAAEPVHRRRHRPRRHRRPGRGDRARQHRHADAGDRRRGVAGRGENRSSNARSRSSASSRSSPIAGIRTIRVFMSTWSRPVPETHATETTLLKNLWNEQEAAALAAQAAGSAALSIEPARRRPADHQLRRRQHELEVRSAGPAHRPAAAGDGGEGQRRRSAVDRRRRVRHALSRQARTISSPAIAAKRTKTRWSALSALRVRREPRRGVDRHAAARVPAVPARRSPAPGLGDCAGGERQRRQKLAEFNRKYGRRIVWVPWQRPGFELALMLRQAVERSPGCDGIMLGGHGLFTWGETQRECYVSSIRTIDQMGEFVDEHAKRAGRPLFGGPSVSAARTSGDGRRRPAALPARRRVVEPPRRRALGRRRGRADVRQLGVGRGALPAGHELSGSLPADAHLPAVRAVGAGRRSGCPSCRPASASAGAVPRRLRRVLQGARAEGFAGAARFEPVGRRHSRRSGCSGSPRTSARRGSRPSSSSTPFT